MNLPLDDGEEDGIPAGVHVRDDGVFVYDVHGEIVSWDIAEFREDPMLWHAVARLLQIYYEHGPHELRRVLGLKIGPYDALRWLDGVRTAVTSSTKLIDEREAIEIALAMFFLQRPEAEALEWSQQEKRAGEPNFELTVFMPKLGLRFEYNDGQHRLIDNNTLEESQFFELAQACAVFAAEIHQADRVRRLAFGSEAVVYVEPGGRIEVTG